MSKRDTFNAVPFSLKDHLLLFMKELALEGLWELVRVEDPIIELVEDDGPDLAEVMELTFDVKSAYASLMEEHGKDPTTAIWMVASGHLDAARFRYVQQHYGSRREELTAEIIARLAMTSVKAPPTELEFVLLDKALLPFEETTQSFNPSMFKTERTDWIVSCLFGHIEYFPIRIVVMRSEAESDSMLAARACILLLSLAEKAEEFGRGYAGRVSALLGLLPKISMGE